MNFTWKVEQNEFYLLTGKEIKNVKFLNFVSKQYILQLL